MIERFERFSCAIAEISKMWHRLAAEEMEKYGLKGSHCIYLLALSRAENGLTAQKLCEMCGKDKADVSRMMKILEEKEFVFKEGTYQNHYGVALHLTEKGLEAAQKVSLKISQAVEFAEKDLTEENRIKFYETLEMIEENMRKMSKEGILLG